VAEGEKKKVSIKKEILSSVDSFLATFPDPLKKIYLSLKEKGYRFGFVGGVVRDLLLNRIPEKEVDILLDLSSWEEIPWDLIPFFRNLVKRPLYRNFTLFLPPYRVDFSLPRKDRYLKPGGFPDVEVGSIEEDLSRRDFTANALLFLEPERTLVDLFSGVNDIERGILRPIHSHTLREDPIRILRGFRYRVRFQWEFSPEWEDVLMERDKLSLFSTVAEGRIFKEFQRISSEENAWEVYRLLHLYDLDLVLLGFSLKEEDFSSLKKIRERGVKKKFLWKEDLSYFYSREPQFFSHIRTFWKPSPQDLRFIKKILGSK
jgi:tRNA nucleotidyltransferase/poly(A) polymerase